MAVSVPKPRNRRGLTTRGLRPRKAQASLKNPPPHCL
nr:MAG TPA: hypothetical protein [Caudoviricetes sp.]DAQ08734.1 MAG TPA: hypothetical protein [Caudoviricetes sp.]DAS50896.1 MAG TPA: hypothetical protein [Caudoviricetes sp.]